MKKIAIYMSNGEQLSATIENEKVYEEFLKKMKDENVKDNEFVLVDFNEEVEAGLCVRKGSVCSFAFFENVEKLETVKDEMAKKAFDEAEAIAEDIVSRIFGKFEAEEDECDCCGCDCDNESEAGYDHSEGTNKNETMENPFLK